MNGSSIYHALDATKCIGCTYCMKSCPTEAIRVVNGLAVIDHERCVYCGQCHRACPTHAFYVVQDNLAMIRSFKYRVILFPSIMIGQFPEKYSEDQIYDGLKKVGFTHVYEVEQPMQVLIDSINEVLEDKKTPKPAISIYCPAIVRLIQGRYPSLTENLILRKAPHNLAAHFAIERLMLEGARREEIGLFYATPCIAKIAAVKSPVGESESIVDGIVNMNQLYNEVMKVISENEVEDNSVQRENLSADGITWSLTRGESCHFGSRSIAIDGIHNAVRFLERLENDQVKGIDFIEMRACDQSCAGGILLTGNRFMTVERLERRAKNYLAAKNISQDTILANPKELKQKLILDPIIPKPHFAFGRDRVKAMEKMDKAQRIVCFLPGIDCGACGAPNCQALAEDMVNNKAKMSDCTFLQQMWVDEGRINAKKAFLNTQKKWGTDRFKADCNKEDDEMKVSEVVEKLGLTVYSGQKGLDREIAGGYVSDLLSDVMGNAREGEIWITLQVHQNVMAIASLKDLAAVILVNNLPPQENTVRHSNDENIPVLGTSLSTFEIAGKLYQFYNQQ